MDQIPVDLVVSEQAVRAGMAAMEHIHGRHLAEMDEDEQAQARDHWRAQVEQVLASVHLTLAGTGPQEGGRAVITFTDAGGEEVEVGIAFTPELREISQGEIEGTPAQLLALTALEALQPEDDQLE
jgi:hypothetical protein